MNSFEKDRFSIGFKYAAQCLFLAGSLICFSACNLFNSSVPEYINKYAYTAGVGSLSVSSSAAIRNSSSDNTLIIPVAGDAEGDNPTVVKMKLRNPQSYNLKVGLEQYVFDSGTTTYQWELVSPSATASNGAPWDSPEYKLEYAHPDLITVTIKKAYVKDEFRLRVTLEAADTTRPPFEPYELPLLRCNTEPDLPLITEGSSSEPAKAVWDMAYPEKSNNKIEKIVISYKQLRMGDIPVKTETIEYTKSGEEWKSGTMIIAVSDSRTTYTAPFPAGYSDEDTSSLQFKVTIYNDDGLASSAQTSGYGDSALNTVYIDPVSGDDTNNSGFSSSRPVKTFSKAIEKLNTTGVTEGKIILLNDISFSYADASTNAHITIDNFIGETLSIIGAGGRKTISGLGSSKKIFYIDNGPAKITLKDLNITYGGHENGSAGGGIYLASGELTLENCDIYLNRAPKGAGLYLTGSGSTVIMNSGSIGNSTNGNTVRNSGGGVYMTDGASFYFGGDALIGYNTGISTGSVDGAGVYIENFASFYMSGGAIRGNKSSNGNGSGMGVYIAAYGKMEMTDGSIDGNIGTYAEGGGVYAGSGNFSQSPEFYMTGGEIKGNRASNGAGISLIGSAKMRMTGGAIGTADSHNTASVYGGGIQMESISGEIVPELIVEGGEITGNVANESGYAAGGGIYVNNGNVIMTGGVIKGNTAPNSDGAGIFLSGTGTNSFTISNDARIDADNIILLGLNEVSKLYRKITLGGDFTGNDIIAKIKIEKDPEIPFAGKQILDLSETGGSISPSLRDRFLLDNSLSGYRIGTNGEIEVSSP